MIHTPSTVLKARYARLNRDWVGSLARHQVEMSREMQLIKHELKERGITA